MKSVKRRKARVARCLTEDEDGKRCSRKAKVRGLCSSCYVIARGCVLRRETTWKKLEVAGKCKKSATNRGIRKFFLGD